MLPRPKPAFIEQSTCLQPQKRQLKVQKAKNIQFPSARLYGLRFSLTGLMLCITRYKRTGQVCEDPEFTEDRLSDESGRHQARTWFVAHRSLCLAASTPNSINSYLSQLCVDFSNTFVQLTAIGTPPQDKTLGFT